MHAPMISLSTIYTTYTIIHLCYKENKPQGGLPSPVGSVAAFLEMIDRYGGLTDVVCVSLVMFHVEYLPVRKVTKSIDAWSFPIIFRLPFLTGT